MMDEVDNEAFDMRPIMILVGHYHDAAVSK